MSTEAGLAGRHLDLLSALADAFVPADDRVAARRARPEA